MKYCRVEISVVVPFSVTVHLVSMGEMSVPRVISTSASQSSTSSSFPSICSSQKCALLSSQTGIDKGSVLLPDALDEGTARISLAGVLSSPSESGADHFVGDGAAVHSLAVAFLVGDDGNGDVVDELRACAVLGEGAKTHDDGPFLGVGVRDAIVTVDFQSDVGCIDIDGLVQVAEGDVVVDVVA